MCSNALFESSRIFHYFKEICALPHGSGNMKKIADYCENFAISHSLKYVRDKAHNIVIYKPASKGYENSPTVILQGHLDMVCQKTAQSNIDFEHDGLDIYCEDGYVKAKGTSLGADNGIAVAMVMALLEDYSLAHPAIEAVFTTDEEVGMVGAKQLDMGLLSGTRMINIDSEEWNAATVSCAGGSDFKAVIPFKRETACGNEITVTLKGLKGGHSGMCINEGRVNADLLAARLLDKLNKAVPYEIISVNGGDKGNAIPLYCEIKLCTDDAVGLKQKAEEYLYIIKEEIFAREPDFEFIICEGACGEYKVIPHNLKESVIRTLLCVPCGVVEMSAEIAGLVETSLNFGVLKTNENGIELLFALRSNKKSALEFLEEKLITYFSAMPADIKTDGHYPPWEFNSNSEMSKIYHNAFCELFGEEPHIEAIHAGLECAVFADKIKDLDGIAIGPQIYDVHTVNEKLDIQSTDKIYKLIINILKYCK